MNPLTWVLALVTALAVASLARFVARRLLGAPVELSGVRELRAELERPGDGAGS